MNQNVQGYIDLNLFWQNIQKTPLGRASSTLWYSIENHASQHVNNLKKTNVF